MTVNPLTDYGGPEWPELSPEDTEAVLVFTAAWNKTIRKNGNDIAAAVRAGAGRTRR